MADDEIVTAAVLAVWLNLTSRRIQQLAAEGVIEKAGRGRYPLRDSVARYTGWLKRQLEDRNLGHPDDDARKESARYNAARADLAELELKQKLGQLAPTEDIELALSALLSGIRAQILAVPAETAQELAEAVEAAECHGIVEDAIHRALEEIAKVRIREVAPPRKATARSQAAQRAASESA